MEIIDLSVPLDEQTPVYSDPRGYSDPLTRLVPWIEIGQRAGGIASPFRVTLLQMGLHTGTHLDAPAHFHPGGKTASDVPAEALVGWAVVVDAGGAGAEVTREQLAGRRQRAAAPETLPLILTPPGGRLSRGAAQELAEWGRPLLAFAGPIDGDDPDCPSTAALLGAGIALATDLDERQARRVRDGDLLVVAPLPLRGVEGAPCRVLAIRGSESGVPTR